MLDDTNMYSQPSALEASLWEAFAEACVEGEEAVAETLLSLIMDTKRSVGA